MQKIENLLNVGNVDELDRQDLIDILQPLQAQAGEFDRQDAQQAEQARMLRQAAAQELDQRRREHDRRLAQEIRAANQDRVNYLNYDVTPEIIAQERGERRRKLAEKVREDRQAEQDREDTSKLLSNQSTSFQPYPVTGLIIKNGRVVENPLRLFNKPIKKPLLAITQG